MHDDALRALSDAQEVQPRVPPRTTHVGFRASLADEVLTARECFAVGCVKETEFGYGPPLRAQVNDPDGYRVEVYFY